jgi:hypothetical protein
VTDSEEPLRNRRRGLSCLGAATLQKNIKIASKTAIKVSYGVESIFESLLYSHNNFICELGHSNQ